LKPGSSNAEAEGHSYVRQKSKVNVLQERDNDVRYKSKGKPEAFNSDKYGSSRRDNRKVVEYQTKSGKLRPSYQEPKVIWEVVEFDEMKIPDLTQQIPDYQAVSPLLNHGNPSHVIIKGPPSFQNVVHQSKLTDALVRDNQRHQKLPEVSEFPLPRKLPQIASSKGSQRDILETSQSRNVVSSPLSDKRSEFVVRFGKPSATEAGDKLSSNKNIETSKVLTVNKDEGKFSGLVSNNSEHTKTAKNTSLNNTQRGVPTSENYKTFRLNKHVNSATENPEDNILEKLIKFGTSTLQGFSKGLGSVFGLGPNNVGGEIPVPGKSSLRESPGGRTLKRSGDIKSSRGNAPHKETSTARTETGQERSY
jgi:hypothetical protein